MSVNPVITGSMSGIEPLGVAKRTRTNWQKFGDVPHVSGFDFEPFRSWQGPSPKKLRYFCNIALFIQPSSGV